MTEQSQENIIHIVPDQIPKRNLRDTLNWMRTKYYPFLTLHKNGVGMTNHIVQEMIKDFGHQTLSQETIWEYLRFIRAEDAYGYKDIADEKDWCAEDIRKFIKDCKKGKIKLIKPETQQTKAEIPIQPSIIAPKPMGMSLKLKQKPNVKKLQPVNEQKNVVKTPQPQLEKFTYFNPTIKEQSEMLNKIGHITHNKEEWDEAKMKNK